MEFITKSDHDFVASTDQKYYGVHGDRWEYISRVIEIIQSLGIEGSVLELGAHELPICKRSDVIDIVPHPHVKYVFDATVTPWNVPDDYDLFIGLQVWEHLGDKQKEAFQEVKRVARSAILSFPYMWNYPGDIHHGIDEDKISEWDPSYKTNDEGIGRSEVYLRLSPAQVVSDWS